MAAHPFFLKRPSISDELGRLVEDQLSKAPQTNTLNDLRSMTVTLSNFASICESVLADVGAQGQEYNPFTAVKEIGSVLAWAKCSFVILFSILFKAELTCCCSSS